MPRPELIATRDFTYNTRRLKAGDEFPARNKMDARILVDVRGRAAYKDALVAPVVTLPEPVEAPPAAVVTRLDEPVEAPKPAAPKKAPAKRRTKAKAKR